MAADLFLFLFLFRSKYRRKEDSMRNFVLLNLVLTNFVISILCENCENLNCIHGVCTNDSCLCEKGWRGPSCQFCGGRIRLTDKFGYISDGPGNYSVDIQCTWLIDAGQPDTLIRLTLEEFATECSWDHLYIHDGDSVFAPLIAVYSGITSPKTDQQLLPEVTTRSGFAFLHFYSDAAFNMTGFNISYGVGGCSRNCSNHGACVGGTCDCQGKWNGDACNIPACLASSCKHGRCSADGNECQCNTGYTGKYCEVPVKKGFWEPISISGWVPEGRAAHQAIINKNYMWIIGGEYFNTSFHENIVRYNLKRNEWSNFTTFGNKVPPRRYGHSIVLHNDNMYMYGGLSESGIILNDLWKLNSSAVWEKISVLVKPSECNQRPKCDPFGAVGHTATTVDNKMVVIFGHNPIYGYLNSVQEYHFETSEWLIVKTKGAIVKGGYGHSSVYDPDRRVIHVHGGYQSDTPTSYTLGNSLFSYNPDTYTWTLLRPSDQPRYFHSAIMSNGVMIIYGGNTHNGSSSHAQCFSAPFTAYDPECDSWSTLGDSSSKDVTGLTRIGHSAVIYDRAMYVYGGFSGQLNRNIVKYTPGTCDAYMTNESCVQALPGVKCMWNKNKNRCQSFHRGNKNRFLVCPEKKSYKDLCSSLTLCPTCLHNSYGCVWCGSYCAHQKCDRKIQVINSLDKCSPADSSKCDKFHNCHSCHTEKYCGWHNDNKCYTFVREIGNRTEKAELTDEHRLKCDTPCSERKTCQNCTQGQCLWCSSRKRCIDNNAYIVSFPFGQCRDWTNHAPKCPATSCADYRSCQACQDNPECGWCDDGSGTGLGTCLQGSSKFPIKLDRRYYKPAPKKCPSSNWFFSTCPTCQCNGHSVCGADNITCEQPCRNLTEGSHCQHCIASYFGNPVNGGKCNLCECNNHATLCYRDTGKCYCTTKGITGHKCDRCDESIKYYGNPKDGGSCFYNLTIDYQFTFNMSKPDDLYYTQINFKNTPSMSDVDVEFSITCSSNAIVNISMVSVGSEETNVIDNRECDNLKIRFSHKMYMFGTEDNTTFYVYVYDFKTPMSVKVSFSQHRTLDLLQFFITFSCCFLSLLVIAAILWKIKQKYELYRRRLRMFVEMENMASRPFSSVLIELEPPDPPPNESDSNVSNKSKICPSPIALEPCYGQRAAVLSLLVRLPTRDQEYALPGQSGLAIASALVTLGSPQKNNSDSSKSETKSKNRKPLTHSHRDTCI